MIQLIYFLIIIIMISSSKCYSYLYRCKYSSCSSNRISSSCSSGRITRITRMIMSIGRSSSSSSSDSINKSRIIKRIMNDNKRSDNVIKIDTSTINVNSIDTSSSTINRVIPSDRIYKRQPKEENTEVYQSTILFSYTY